MEIRWNNIIALMLIIVVLVILSRSGAEIGAFLSGIQRVGAGYSPDDRMFGFIAFGLVSILIVAIVKILTQGK